MAMTPTTLAAPVIAIVGRENVGKSTLFNRLTRSKNALVVDIPGVTRDRNYGDGSLGSNQKYIVIDTGGITGDDSGIDGQMAAQVQLAINEADMILFVVDARAGMSAIDAAIADSLRVQGKKVYLLVNKTDTLDEHVVTADFHQLALGKPHAIAALHGRGVTKIIKMILDDWHQQQLVTNNWSEPASASGIKIAVLGRPNVGKSTLINRVLGEQRVVVSSQPGTTRDSIMVPLVRDDKNYILIDTAGIRRRAKIKGTVEKFSIIKSLRAVGAADVVVFLVDATEGVTEQDLHLIGYVLQSGRSLVIAVNKWDGLSNHQRKRVKDMLSRRFDFLNFVSIQMISALHGTGVGNLFPAIDKAHTCASKSHPTAKLTKLLQDAVSAHPPPIHNHRRIKLRYAHLGDTNPPLIIIHGNKVDDLPESYHRYLVNYFRKALKLVGTILKIEFRSGNNPFANRRNSAKR